MTPSLCRRLFIACLAGALLARPGAALAQPACPDPSGPGPTLPCTGCAKAAAWAWRQAQGRPLTDEALENPAEAAGDTDLLNVNLDLEVFPATASLSGVCTLTVRSLTANLTQFTFRLRSQFAISSAMINGVAPASVATISTTTRVATLDRAYQPGETFTLTVAYSGAAASRGFGSIEFRSQGGQPLVSTLSEPFYAYTWWPAKDGDVGAPGDNADKATFQLAITAPDTLVSVSNGLLQGVDVLPGARKRHRWATAYPQAVYLACFSTTNYNAWTRTYTFPGSGATMPVQFFIYPDSDTPANRAAWEVCLPALTVFGDLLGPYPFAQEKYGIYQFPFGGGMEHQTMTGQGTFAEYVTVHELAHQWWGDDVTCRTWGDIWLNEGFATYSEALWEERKPGGGGLPALQAAMNARRPQSFSGTVYAADISSAGPIFNGDTSYRKGGWVLHMLRRVVGDQAFFATLQTYRQAHQGGAAATADFQAAASSVSGLDLAVFFNQWIYAPGAPAYAYGWSPITVNGRSYVKLHIRQTQDPAFGIGGLYDMPIDVRLSPAGQGPPVTLVVRSAALLTHAVLPAPAPIASITLDPDDWILTTGKRPETYLPGPPVVVETSPAPGAVLPAAEAQASITIHFSEAMATSAGQFSLSSAGGGNVPTIYQTGPQRVTLGLAAPLPPGRYTLAVASGPVSVQTGLALDGEASSGLPSGDGFPGGGFSVEFTVEGRRCEADFNRDGRVDPDDLSDYIACYFSAPPCPEADLNADTIIDPDDLSDFISTFFASCP